jgi:hypothetical protein
VRIGVRHAPSGIQGHAWVEIDGVSLGRREGYLVLYGLEQASA